MARLEPWQRYRKSQPCPVCGGYGAYRPENRCVGFLSADGEGAYCSQVSDGRSAVWFEALGMNLYWHPNPEGEGEVDRAGQFHRRYLARRVTTHRILRMRYQGMVRAVKAKSEAARRPDWRDFG